MMNPREMMLAGLEEWIAKNEINGIKQHSDEWHKVRLNAIGGSSMATIQGLNPYSSICKIVSEKIGFTEFISDIKPQWGNLFEDVIKRVVEYQKKCVVYGEDLYILGEPGTSYSPDGLAVMDIVDTSTVEETTTIDTPDGPKQVIRVIEKRTPAIAIVLLEFKCPYSRIPNGVVPKYYVPQVKMGLDLLGIPSIGLFVEGVFRRCTWEDLGNNPKYDTTLVKASSGKFPQAFGILGFYIDVSKYGATADNTSDQKRNKLFSMFTDHYVEYGDETNDYMAQDLGQAPVDLFTIIMDAYNEKILTPWYGGISFADSPLDMQNELNKYVKFCADGKFLNFGIIPWKLFRIDYNFIQKEVGYVQPWLPKIREIINVVQQCNDPANVDKKYNIYASYMNKCLDQ